MSEHKLFTAEELDRLTSIALPLLAVEARARELELREVVPKAVLFVGLCGCEPDFDSTQIFRDFAVLRRVANPPGVIHVARASNHRSSDYLGISRYSNSITSELACGQADWDEPNRQPKFILDMAWHLAALFKLRGFGNLISPAVASCSWDVVAAKTDGSIDFRILDDVPRQIALPATRTAITMADVDWVSTNAETALELRNFRKSRRFGLAFSLMYTWNHTIDRRIALANIWAGLEALFGRRDDRRITEVLTQRIVDWVSGATVQEVRYLYDRRCDAVHGRWFRDDSIESAIEKSDGLLRSALVRCIESNAATLSDW